MGTEREQRGDREESVWLKDIPAMNRITPALMPNGADNEAHITVDIRLLNAYLEKVNAGRTEDKYTFCEYAPIEATASHHEKIMKVIHQTKCYAENSIKR